MEKTAKIPACIWLSISKIHESSSAFEKTLVRLLVCTSLGSAFKKKSLKSNKNRYRIGPLRPGESKRRLADHLWNSCGDFTANGGLFGHFLIQIRTSASKHLNLNTLVFPNKHIYFKISILLHYTYDILALFSSIATSPKSLQDIFTLLLHSRTHFRLPLFLAEAWVKDSTLVDCLLTPSKSQPCLSFQTSLWSRGWGTQPFYSNMKGSAGGCCLPAGTNGLFQQRVKTD